MDERVELKIKSIKAEYHSRKGTIEKNVEPASLNTKNRMAIKSQIAKLRPKYMIIIRNIYNHLPFIYCCSSKICAYVAAFSLSSLPITRVAA